MELIPFTLDEAVDICEDFEDLTDTEFKIGTLPLLLVEAVLVAPFGEADKNKFAESYWDTKNVEDALGHYNGSGYDVLLITSEDGDNGNYSYIDIRTFANLRGIKYSFPG